MKMMQHDLSGTRQASELLTQQVGPETLVYNERTHQAFCLNPVTAQVWKLLGRGLTLAEISAAASLALGTPVTEDAALFALAELRRNRLLEPEPEPVLAARPVPTRRQLMRQIGAGALVMLPAVAVIMAPKAAQAYNGCVNCDAEHGTSSVAAAKRARAQPLPAIDIVPDPGSPDSTEAVRKKRQQNGEIFIP